MGVFKCLWSRAILNGSCIATEKYFWKIRATLRHRQFDNRLPQSHEIAPEFDSRLSCCGAGNGPGRYCSIAADQVSPWRATAAPRRLGPILVAASRGKFHTRRIGERD